MRPIEVIGYDILEFIQTGSPFTVNNVVIGIPFNLQQLVDKFGKDCLPKKLGIYHLFYNDQLIYVGMSKNVGGRLLQHLKDADMPFNNCLWFIADHYKEGATVKDVLEIEYRMIKMYKPVLNSAHANCR